MRRVRPTIAAHGLAVAKLTDRVCSAISVDADERALAVAAALVHDIGKIHVPENILFKRGVLEPREFEVLRRHALDGERIVLELTGRRRMATIVGQHHERLDGRGYPRGIGSGAIDPLSSIVSAADAYVAMREERPYSKARSCTEALMEMQRHSGSQFVSSICDTIIQLVA